MTQTDDRLILLRPGDNVLVLAAGTTAGEALLPGGAAPGRALSLGHKIAARDIAAGETIVKYGAPIGVATAEIPAGAHVHVHNIRSAYTPTYVTPEAT